MAIGLDIGIVGAGYAGTAAALFLNRAGHRVVIYEEAAQPSAIGAGILLQPSGLRVLSELGLLESVLDRGTRVDGLLARTAAGKSVVDLRYRDFAPSWFGIGMHRGALFELLHAAVQTAKIELRVGASIQRLEQLRHGRLGAVLPDGTRAGEHQLILVCDGARSDLRRYAEGLQKAEPYPWGALWFVAEDPERIYDGCLFQVARGTERLLGFLPSGLGPRGGDGVPLVSLFWSIRSTGFEDFRRQPLDDWKREVLDLDPRAAFVLDQIRDPSDLLTAGYLDVVMDPWHTGAIAFLGDAGHAMSPQLGQGCNLALEDARSLACCIDAEPSVSAALNRYSTLRREHLNYYQFASRALTPLFQSDYGLLAIVRDALMGPLCRFPVSRDLMLATLAGVQRDLLGPHMPLEPIHRAFAKRRS